MAEASAHAEVSYNPQEKAIVDYINAQPFGSPGLIAAQLFSYWALAYSMLGMPASRTIDKAQEKANVAAFQVQRALSKVTIAGYHSAEEQIGKLFRGLSYVYTQESSSVNQDDSLIRQLKAEFESAQFINRQVRTRVSTLSEKT